MLRVWILERYDLTLTGKTALKMVAYFLRPRRILGASGPDGGKNEDQEGLHLEMLMSSAAFANGGAVARATGSPTTSGCQRSNSSTIRSNSSVVIMPF